MKEILLTYKPVKWLSYIRYVKGHHPENWDEITPRQLTAIARSYLGKINECRFLYVLTGVKYSVVSKLDDFQRYNILELLGFVGDNRPFHSFILKRIYCEGNTFYSPESQLKNLSFGQFIFIDSYFNNFSHHQNAEDLHKFLAALYVPDRGKFKESFIDKNNSLMEKLPPETKEAILINYMLVKQWLSVKYPLIFVSGQVSDSSKFSASMKNKTVHHDPMAWVKILDNIIGDDISNHKKYTSLPLHNVLRFMTRKVKEAAKQKK